MAGLCRYFQRGRGCLSVFHEACRQPSLVQLTMASDPNQSVHAIPRKKGWPIIGTLPEATKYYGLNHELFRNCFMYEEFGPIYYEKTGMLKIVFVSDLNALEKLLRQEGKYPFRISFPMWDQYRIDAQEGNGLVTSQNEEWQRMRSVVDKPLMKAKTVENYADDFIVVASEFLDRLASIRDSDRVVKNIDVELFHWALESIATVLYEKRLGCLSDDRSSDTTEFIKAVQMMFRMTMKLFVYPPWFLKTFMPGQWKTFTESWDTLFKIAKKCIDEKVEKISDRPEDEPTHPCR